MMSTIITERTSTTKGAERAPKTIHSKPTHHLPAYRWPSV
uniref:Uncharacterized protein n=1 Tax=Arundo donax TaxID=35708 RepID=A0A0A8YFH1_ARUDO